MHSPSNLKSDILSLCLIASVVKLGPAEHSYCGQSASVKMLNTHLVGFQIQGWHFQKHLRDSGMEVLLKVNEMSS